LCLDEPFSALDVLSAEALRGELMELWLAHTIPTQAVLMVTHNIEEAVLMADRIVVMGKEPGHIVAELKVTLRHPRARKDTAFQALVDRVYAAVAGRTPVGAGDEGAVARLGKALPMARPNAVAGLVEKLLTDGGRADLPRFALELQLPLDELLPVVEAAELPGLVTVAEGDLFLTPLGETYAAASILARKELIAGRMLRVPAVRWIYETLQADDNQRTDRDYFVEKLREQFGDNAEAQLEAAIAWGRFAELFAYDAASNELFLET
jgi:NitT/TauT family transport system ATP-binding protein